MVDGKARSHGIRGVPEAEQLPQPFWYFSPREDEGAENDVESANGEDTDTDDNDDIEM